MEPRRCAWAESGGPEGLRYHDEEWGVPVHDDTVLFEVLTLEGAQAGLSWWTILRKREAYRKAFAHFDVRKVARFSQRKITQLLNDEGIVRNQLKIRSTIANARATLAVQRQMGSLDRFLWQFVSGAAVQNARSRRQRVPARTAQSDAMSAALRAAGFSFVGSTICYALMQAVGMVNDHATDCFRWAEVQSLGHPRPVGRGR